MKTLVYLLFTSMVATTNGSPTPTVTSTTTVVPTKTVCMQGVADFIGASNYKRSGNEGVSTIQIGAVKLTKMATCSISEEDE